MEKWRPKVAGAKNPGNKEKMSRRGEKTERPEIAQEESKREKEGCYSKEEGVGNQLERLWLRFSGRNRRNAGDRMILRGF
jgi:hypothetical protein